MFVISEQHCKCKPQTHQTNFTNLKQRIKEIVKEMKIDKKRTSLAKRKLISIDDKRPTCKGIGYFAIAFMTAVFGGLVLMDLSILIEHARRAIKRLGYRFSQHYQ